jgi:hypothetical protein
LIGNDPTIDEKRSAVIVECERITGRAGVDGSLQDDLDHLWKDPDPVHHRHPSARRDPGPHQQPERVVDIVDDCWPVTDSKSLLERPAHLIWQPDEGSIIAVPLLCPSHAFEEIDDASAKDATADGREWGQWTADRMAAICRRRRNDRSWTPGVDEPIGVPG